METEINEKEIDIALEQRADYITSKELKDGTATSDFFDEIISTLLKKQTTLIVGPRGCGKTHMMRYASILCKDDAKKPLAIYVSFNRYYRLEPMLISRANAINLFHTWVLSRIIVATHEALAEQDEVFSEDELQEALEYIDISDLQNLIAKLERSLPLTQDELDLANSITLHTTKKIIDNHTSLGNRPRAILLLDDAALTLTPEYMAEFFEIFRSIKSPYISPKASVYPGTTEYGARFHPTQEGGFEHVWLSVSSPHYIETMHSIAAHRIPDFSSIPDEIRQYLAYAAFGIPRAYLHMIMEFQKKKFSTVQQGLNRIVQSHTEARIEEFLTLAIKAPKLKTIIEQGNALFSKLVLLLKEFNDKLAPSGTKQLLIGITGIKDQPMVERMFNLLIEAGLLYPVAEKVSHGEDRKYDRYTPHIAALLHERAFSAKARGWSARIVVDKINQKTSRQPLRRSVSSLFTSEELSSLKFDLPACSTCGKERITATQKYCHHCGAELLDSSTFETCMSLPLHEVPGLTKWTVAKLKQELPRFKTIGDLLSVQDPGTELRKIHRVGQARAEKIIRLVTSFVDEFLQ
ncbi:AAA family ATPase [Pseudomonas aeruginosa]|uniref:ORC-CDC6 family AAA ATPase n=1 Tax=Pseudomonas aeruginosa TaxID=287 RepID=UPI00068C341F|nr:AAA family ATPase [Pseudomonas aeruginosa]EIZ0541065.1 AAA family ATPase [Pseudomonas aeruginosa]EKW0409778.1 AAA family ATPase [Pseudomonas aeruginosa]EKW1685437.1 AAA family ATPase [Pseudomonas aeruginosa]ELO0615670.1 AAA family ATPase [Pseudomonas aeruginosa]ELO0649425.1 AAA family ATPase [Pseudomonas aeruginosa]